MSKITQYLNEHILGEATSNVSVLDQFSRDGSIFSIKPEAVISPRTTNDIRKIARFTWQLVEKNHAMSITARGNGSDKTGAAIGKGIIINTLAHLNNIIYVSLKNKDQFIHVQPGINLKLLNEVLKSHGLTIASTSPLCTYGTIGGAVANNNGSIGDLVTRMEIVLANGDLIESSRISKHELNKKKGLQTFEGEIYRKIDGIIEDNQEFLTSKANDNKLLTNTGYFGITKVKQRDGSFDLTPLIVGSQGTLGIISEIVIKTDFLSSDESVIVVSFENIRAAHDVADSLLSLVPKYLEVIDGRIFKQAEDMGKHYLFSDNAHNAVIYLSFNNFSEGARKSKIKNAIKKIVKLDSDAKIFSSNDYPIENLYAIREVSSVILQPESSTETMPPLIDGAAIHPNKREDFISELDNLATKHHIELPTQINWLTNIINTRAALQLHNVSDKQKAFKLINDYAELVAKFDGSMTASAGEGRIKAPAIYAQTDTELLEIYKQVKETFDPLGILNPGVKQNSDLKTLISYLNPDYNLAYAAKYSPKL